jgi:CDP-glucose 4,6-dehydratase
MVKEFWQGRKVFLTGHTGFKGSWLVLWLRTGAAHHAEPL